MRSSIGAGIRWLPTPSSKKSVLTSGADCIHDQAGILLQSYIPPSTGSRALNGSGPARIRASVDPSLEKCDPCIRHSTKIDRIDAALRALGKRLSVEAA
jgi:hypothetical protein